MAVTAVGGLAGDTERIADLDPARAPVQRPGNGVVERGLGGAHVHGGGLGCGESVDAETIDPVHGCKRTLTRRCLSVGADRHRSIDGLS